MFISPPSWLIEERASLGVYVYSGGIISVENGMWKGKVFELPVRNFIEYLSISQQRRAWYEPRKGGGGILVYNIFFISVSIQFLMQTSEYWKFIVGLTQTSKMSLMCWTLFVQRGFRNSKFCQECTSSLALLPPRNFAVFETQYLLEYYTQGDKYFTRY